MTLIGALSFCAPEAMRAVSLRERTWLDVNDV
jgi:hypothetical protein